MKTFKLLDSWISTGLIISCSIIVFLEQSLGYLISCYFIVGGWQVISMITHALNGWFTHRQGTRYVYHWVSLICLVTIPMGFAYPMIFLAPIMGVFYTYLCFDEVYNQLKRPLAVLK